MGFGSWLVLLNLGNAGNLDLNFDSGLGYVLVDVVDVVSEMS